jgi:SAM-dependent methyltransferase
MTITPEGTFHSQFYLLHNEKRIEHLHSVGLPITKDMTVLEVGAGIGDHTKYFINIGCNIVTTEGRQENVDVLKKYVGNKATVALLDLENPSPNPIYDKKFDIVYCYGTLYHLSNPDSTLNYLSERCGGMLLLETCVSFKDGKAINNVNEATYDPSQSLSGKGCRPTRLWLFDKMKSLFPYVYFTKTQPDHYEFPTDWTVPSKHELSRVIMFGSRTPIENRLLLEIIPSKQERFKK